MLHLKSVTVREWQAHEEDGLLALDAKLTRELQLLLNRAGLRQGRATGEYDDATRAALEQVFGIENLG